MSLTSPQIFHVLPTQRGSFSVLSLAAPCRHSTHGTRFFRSLKVANKIEDIALIACVGSRQVEQ